MTIDFKNKIYLGVASPVEDGDMSNYYTKAQTRALVDAKQDVITGAATTITDNNLTANRALISNSNGKVDVATTTTTELNYVHGVTSAIQTQLNAKASTALDNLSSGGQMIIDSANGTISNCILEIPQNLKLTLENNVLTLKAGSTITLTGSIYTTFTTTSDNSKTYSPISSQRNKRNYVFCGKTGNLTNLYQMDKVKSGSTSSRPETAANGEVFFDTDEKSFYLYNNGWAIWPVAYPLCMIDVDENGVASFAKDSKGRDIIFNGAGFIGHHAFVYPNVKALIPYGLNDDGSLKSNLFINQSLQIIELRNPSYSSNWYYPIQLNAGGAISKPAYRSIETKDELLQQSAIIQYVEPDNQCYLWNGSSFGIQNWYPFIDYNYDGTTVTDFTIRQPVRTATVEMLDKKQDNITTITGYDATKIQTLKNVNGVLTWVDD